MNGYIADQRRLYGVAADCDNANVILPKCYKSNLPDYTIGVFVFTYQVDRDPLLCDLIYP